MFRGVDVHTHMVFVVVRVDDVASTRYAHVGVDVQKRMFVGVLAIRFLIAFMDEVSSRVAETHCFVLGVTSFLEKSCLWCARREN